MNKKIFQAIEEENINFIKENLDKIDVNQKDDIGYSLLHRAVYYGNCKIVRLLLTSGANINILDNDNFTPLHSIIEGNQNNWFDCIELLLKNNANVNTELCWQESNHKESPLITAVRNGVYIDVIKLLIEHGADINYKDSDNDNAIRYANDLGRNDVFKLLEEKGAIYDDQLTSNELMMIEYAQGMEKSYKLREQRQKTQKNLEEL